MNRLKWASAFAGRVKKLGSIGAGGGLTKSSMADLIILSQRTRGDTGVERRISGDSPHNYIRVKTTDLSSKRPTPRTPA